MWRPKNDGQKRKPVGKCRLSLRRNQKGVPLGDLMHYTAEKEIANSKQVLKSNHEPNGGYFKVPDFIFDLGLEPYEILVFTNLIRRANKSGECYPSLARICRDTGIKSENTVRKTISSLISKKFVTLLSRKQGCSNRYQVSPTIYETIKLADSKYNNKKQQQKKLTPSFDEGVTPSKSMHKPTHEMSTKENKKENKFFKENSENVVFEKEVLGKGVANGNRAVSANPFKFEKHKMEKNLLKKLGFNPKRMLNDSTPISELDPISKENADGHLEFIRRMNLRVKPEIYEIE